MEELKHKLKAYKSIYYRNQLIRGVLFTLLLLSLLFLAVTFLEYSFHFDTPGRKVLLISYILLLLASLGWGIARPLWFLWKKDQYLSDEEAARQIGNYFSEIDDKLLNIIQLNKSKGQIGSLLSASISQKTAQLQLFDFSAPVRAQKPVTLVRWAGGILLFMLLISLLKPEYFRDTSTRIIHYNQAFVPEAPFQFSLENKNLQVFRNEDFTLKLHLEGSAFPEEVRAVVNGKMLPMQKHSAQDFSLSIPHISESKDFHFTGGDFQSNAYHLSVVDRPLLEGLKVKIQYPNYLHLKDPAPQENGNLIVPAGSKISWELQAQHTDSVIFKFGNQTEFLTQASDNQKFNTQKQVFRSQPYTISLKNKFGQNKHQISYQIQVMADAPPQIEANSVIDSTLYQQVVIGGQIKDDHGFSRLQLIVNKGNKRIASLPIGFKKGLNPQSFYFTWNIDSLRSEEGAPITYHVAVWDNDVLAHYKKAESQTFYLKIPSQEEMRQAAEKSSKALGENIKETHQKTKGLKQDIEKIDDILKTKRKLNWEDKQLVDQFLQKKENLHQQLDQLKKQQADNQKKREQLAQENPDLKKKAEDLKKLLEKVEDPKEKELLEKLKELMKKTDKTDDLRNTVDQLKQNSQQNEHDLNRLFKLYEQLQFEYKLQDIVAQLDDLSKKQEKAAKEDSLANQANKENKQDKSQGEINKAGQKDQQDNPQNKTEKQEKSREQLKAEQEKLNQDFRKMQKKLKDLKEENQKRSNPADMEDTHDLEEQIQKDQQKATQSLQEGNKSKAQQQQKNAAQGMKQMQQKLKGMQSTMQMIMLQENIRDLEKILDNLIQLSFDQENLMKKFKAVDNNDPAFVSLTEAQLQIKENSEIIQDSLNALASRVFQLQSFITRELGEMNHHLEGSMEALQNRDKGKAVGKEQFAMASMNNLALMLQDLLDNMQQQMAQSMGMKSKQQSSNQQSLSQQQQQLMDKLQKLKKSGKQGRALSKDMADAADQQMQLRQKLEKMKQNLNKGEGKNRLEEIDQLMKQSEEDIVYKRLTDQLIQRQKKIVTRLLESEKSQREQETDPKREAQKPGDYDKDIPPALKAYFEKQKSEVELLQTIPPDLTPFYQQKTNDYFKRLGSKENNN